MSYSDRIKNSFTESALIGAVAGIGSVVGADTVLADLLGNTGILGTIPAQYQRALVLFTVVFAADMVYNLFLA